MWDLSLHGEGLKSLFKKRQLIDVAYTYNIRTWEPETGRWQIWGYMGDCLCSPTLYIILPISQIKRILGQRDALSRMRVNSSIWSALVILLQDAPLSGLVGGAPICVLTFLCLRSLMLISLSPPPGSSPGAQTQAPLMPGWGCPSKLQAPQCVLASWHLLVAFVPEPCFKGLFEVKAAPDFEQLVLLVLGADCPCSDHSLWGPRQHSELSYGAIGREQLCGSAAKSWKRPLLHGPRSPFSWGPLSLGSSS